MRPGELARTAAFLARVAASPRGAPDPAVVEERAGPDETGLCCDHYRPRGEARGAVVALHGLTLEANRHARLIHFARSLAASGISCAVPRLPGLASLRCDPSDVDRLAELLAGSAPGRRAPGLIGFSFGASYALLAAARAGARDRVRFVLGVGAYCSLAELIAHYQAEPGRPGPVTDAEWDDAVYLRLVLAHHAACSEPTLAALAPAIESLLHRYCEEASPEEKRAFHDAHLRHLDVPRLAGALADAATCERLSPAGKLGAIGCPIFLVHDRDDRLVPAAHSRRLAGEAPAAKLLVTSLLAHVTWADRTNLLELWRLIRALSPLLG